MLNQPEGFNMLNGLDKIEGLTPEQIEAISGLTGGLINKNDELLKKLSETKSTVNESQGALEKLAAIEALQAQKELENKQHYDQALQLNSTKYTQQISELSEKVNLFEQKERNTMIGNGITDALTEIRVNPLHSELVNTYFRQNAQLIDGEVKIGDKSLSDAIKEWSETDQGKAVRLAPDNSGGNSKGSNQMLSGSGTKMTESEQRAFDINKRLGR